MNGDEKPVGVAVLGLGNVGSQVVRIIEESAEDLTARIGAPLVLRGVGVRRVADDRRPDHGSQGRHPDALAERPGDDEWLYRERPDSDHHCD